MLCWLNIILVELSTFIFNWIGLVTLIMYNLLASCTGSALVDTGISCLRLFVVIIIGTSCSVLYPYKCLIWAPDPPIDASKKLIKSCSFLNTPSTFASSHRITSWIININYKLLLKGMFTNNCIFFNNL